MEVSAIQIGVLLDGRLSAKADVESDSKFRPLSTLSGRPQIAVERLYSGKLTLATTQPPQNVKQAMHLTISHPEIISQLEKLRGGIWAPRAGGRRFLVIKTSKEAILAAKVNKGFAL